MTRATQARGVIRAAATRLMTKLKDVSEAAEPSCGDLSDAITALEGKAQLLKSLDDQVHADIEDEAFAEDFATAVAYQDDIAVSLSRARRLLAQWQNATDTRIASQATSEPSTLSDRVQSQRSRPVALPKLHVPQFSGKSEEWQGFWDHFRTTIHESPSLAKIEKFQYLLSYLTGQAKRAIEWIAISDSNYDNAVATLRTRFGRQGTLVDAHIDQMLSLLPVPSSKDVGKLRELHDNIQFRVGCLDNLGVPKSQYAVVLHRVLMRCIPEDLAVEFRQRQIERAEATPRLAGDDDRTLTERVQAVADLMKFLRVHIESREDCRSAQRRAPPRETSLSTAPDNPPTALSLTTPSVAGRPQPCPLCGSNTHAIKDCDKALSASEKRRLLQSKRCCFRCGKVGHTARNCRTSRTLTCSSCGGRHLSLLCDVARKPTDASGERSTTLPPAFRSIPAQDGQSVATAMCVRPVTTILLQTARVWAVGSDSHTLVRVLLDTGSQRTYVTRQLSMRLRCPVLGTEDLTVYTFGRGRVPTRYRCHRVAVQLRGQYSADPLTIEALEVPEVCSIMSPNMDRDILGELQVLGLPPADARPLNTRDECDISVLIGSDIYWSVVSGAIRRLPSGLTAVETSFGWMLQGKIAHATPAASSVVTTLTLAHGPADACPGFTPADMWKLDAIGITDTCDEPDVVHPALQLFEDLVSHTGSRYQVPLLIKHSCLGTLADNRTLAESRLRAQLRRFRGHPDLMEQYHAAISEYFTEGHAERVPEAPGTPENVYYLPHHAVVRREAVTTKVRVVFDASSHVGSNPSLNDVLHKGPNLNADLLRQLVSFRCYPLVLTADIRKAYLQILIRPEDRDALRFLWIAASPSTDCQSPAIHEWRMTRVPFGAASSPFLLAATLRHHFASMAATYPATVERLRHAFYVDDLVLGAASDVDGLKLYRDAVAVLAEAGMDLRKWASNSPVLHQQFLADGISYANVSQQDTIKVLGLLWHRPTDEVTFRIGCITDYLTNRPITKRTVLHAIARIFDPLGYLTPYTIRARLFFQSLWACERTWDDTLPPQEAAAWMAWCAEVNVIDAIRLPRRLLPFTNLMNGSCQLHVFADASPRAYGAVIYIRAEQPNSLCIPDLLLGKGRVAPLKTMSLPQLELLACLIAARLTAHIQEIPILRTVQTHFWTDSTIALHWITGDPSRRATFVRNRVHEIQRLTAHGTWHHCTGHDNPADLVTRGIAARSLRDSPLWWHGPPWLGLPHDSWGFTNVPPEAPVIDDEPPTLAVPATPSHGPLLDLAAHSRYTRVLRITAWIRRFINRSRSSPSQVSGPLTAHELASAEEYWIRHTQAEAFPTEVSAFITRHELPPESSIHVLAPFMDCNHIVRVGGRLDQMRDPEQVKHPILLPSHHRFSELLILATHERLCHAGVQSTLVDLRDRFWVLKGRQTVKRVIARCLLCRRNRLRPEEAPVAPLPIERITRSCPFDVVGVDFCGPLYLKHSPTTATKSYITVFSCAVTRAIHLELATNMSASAFLLAFRRFIARRGIPSLVYSDNARAFHRCAQVLATLPTEEVQDFMTSLRIHWRFNTPHAPWWGGWWERIIRNVKSSLRVCLGKRRLSFEEMTTILHEVEAAVNSRPLTYVAEDPQDNLPLTPAHLVLGKRAVVLPPAPGEVEQLEVSLGRLNERRRRILDDFWKRWKREYLLQLRSAHEGPRCRPTELKAGDVVIVEDAAVPALLWKTAMVLARHPGRDGIARTFTLRLPNDRIITRPAQRLFLLEASQASGNIVPPGRV